MKKIFGITGLLGIMIMFSGCATTYMSDRGRDAADIFTATVGIGAGAKARVGPIQAGLLGDCHLTGLRAGKFPCRQQQCDIPATFDLQAVAFGLQCLRCDDHIPGQRGKEFEADFNWIPFWAPAKPHGFPPEVPSCPAYWSQIEVVIGLGPTIRLGFNPGELVDFLLGWVHVDIYKDDLERRMSRIED